ncbi:putative gustatory receptor 59f [Drosophila innubila]|uniref:putative gustatory receptor 59f n=1 Tax=Drosophila innubila TaxID=198719 RepID=UPI00148C7B6E|nr:putative gustatory receptor 59f [Drosophila innubila]
MLHSKLRQASRKRRQVAVNYFPKGNWNLTQKLHKSNSEQLRDEMQLMLLICVLSGGAPIAVFPRFRGKFFNAVQHFWLIALYAWLCSAAYWELMHSSIKLNELEHKFYCIEALTYLIHVPCIMILSMRWKHGIAAVIDRIAQFDLTSGYMVKSGSISRNISYHLLAILIFTVCYIPIDFCYCQYQVWKTFFDLSTYLLPNILSGISFIPYFILLQGICRRLHCLTESLKVELRRGLFMQRSVIQQLRLQHLNLLHFTKAVNQTFGVSVLCVIVSSFFNVNTNLFLAYKNMESPNVEDWAWWMDILLWLLIHLYRMYIILYFNHGVQQEQVNCLNLLIKVQTDSEALIESVNHFTLQLQANVRAYVACGLIVLDYKFITTLLMAITNVFIFLLQYEITYQALSTANETKI